MTYKGVSADLIDFYNNSLYAQDRNTDYPDLENFKTANHMVDRHIATTRVGRKAQMAKQDCSKDNAFMHARLLENCVRTIAAVLMVRRACLVCFIKSSSIRASIEFLRKYMTQNQGMCSHPVRFFHCFNFSQSFLDSYTSNHVHN